MEDNRYLVGDWVLAILGLLSTSDPSETFHSSLFDQTLSFVFPGLWFEPTEFSENL